MANIVSQTPSISEVKAVLAETANSVGGLCTSPKIKKWSKWKPVRHSSKGNLTETQLENINFGFDIPIVDSGGDLGGLAQEWTYIRPTGGESSPYRIGDFRNYNHNAEIPFDIEMPGDVVSTEDSSILIKHIPKSTPNVSINANKIYGNMYFGVCISIRGQKLYKTALSEMSTGISSINIKESGLLEDTGTFEVYCFYTSEQITEFTGIPPWTAFSLNAEPGMAFRAVSLKTPVSPKYYIDFEGFNVLDKNILKLEGTINVRTMITQPCVLNMLPTVNYSLTGIRVTVQRNKDKVYVFNQLFADASATPKWILRDGLVEEPIDLKCTKRADASDFPDLTGGDFYIIKHIFVYQES